MIGQTSGMPVKWVRRSMPPIADEMEATWGPDHITTIPEDYAQHVILGVSFVKSLGTQILAYPVSIPSNV